MKALVCMKSPRIVFSTVFAVCVCAPISTLARDVYVVQGFAAGASFNRQTTIWSTDALFFNKGSRDGVVTLLGISNGVDPIGRVGQSFIVSSKKTASLQQVVRWVPAIPLLVLHLDVPDD